ncbi:MAG: hypothetical protein P8N72_10225 [Flavimaricola sp.]|nr:hypothetical protein [Flavimaricola sp.]
MMQIEVFMGLMPIQLQTAPGQTGPESGLNDFPLGKVMGLI